MAISSLHYEPPVRRSARFTPLDYGLFEQAVALSEEGRPIESITKVFEHLFPGRPIPNLATQAFSFTQGSSHVTARVDGDDFVIEVPLVRLPSGGSAIAAMRHVLTKIAGSGQLYQPRLNGDDVKLEFRDRISRLHPAKIVEVLRRMPEEADDNDDFLIGQFTAQPLDRAPIQPLDDAEMARCEAIWKLHWDEVDELLKECRRKRSMFFLNELTSYAYHRLTFALPLSGFVAARLDESASDFNDSDEDPMKREAVLGKCSKEMRAVSSADLRKSLGHAEYAISPLGQGTPRVLADHIGKGHYLDAVDQLRKSSKAMDAAVALFGTYTFLLSRFAWSEAIERELKAGLAGASDKPFRDMANTLFENARGLVAKFAKEEEEEKLAEEEEKNEEDEEDEDEEDDADEEEGEDEDA
jgi:hypothetical protein